MHGASIREGQKLLGAPGAQESRSTRTPLKWDHLEHPSNAWKTRQENEGGDKAGGGAGRGGGCKELPSLHLSPAIFLLSSLFPLTSSQAFPSYNQIVFGEKSIIL